MKCLRCTDPTYCPCADFFASWTAYHRGELDHWMTDEQVARRLSERAQVSPSHLTRDH
jgi:hypothetical protein